MGKNGHKTTADEAYDRLEELIIMLNLKAGEMVSEKFLVDKTGFGRTPIREALQRLELENLVEIYPRRGIQIKPISVITQLNLLEVRRPLELMLVERACDRASTSEREHLYRLSVTLIEIAGSGDVLQFMRTNREVHRCLTQAAHNDILFRVLSLLHSQSRRFWYAHQAALGSFEKAAKLHSEVLRSVASSDKVRAKECGQALIDYLEAFARDAFEKLM